MSFNPLIDQRPLLPSGGTDCAEACLGMVLGHLGHPYNMQSILAYHNGVTSTQTLLQMCAHFGLTGCTQINGGFDNNDKLVIALIHDNSYANPDVHGAFEHFIVVYDQPNGNSVQAANPWGARDINYPDSVFNPAYMGGIVIPVKANTVQGDVMNQGQATAIAAMIIRLGDDVGDPRPADWSPLATAVLNGDTTAVINFIDQIKTAQSVPLLTLQGQVTTLNTEIAALKAASGLTLAQVQAEIVKVLKAGEAGV